MTYLITGGAGFIGSNFVKRMLATHPEAKLVIFDALTYAGNLGTLAEELKDSRVTFVKGDICDKNITEKVFSDHQIDFVVNFAAESHVDRSIKNPDVFVKTNVLGTLVMLNAAKAAWELPDGTFKEGKKFLHVSTDEVYGSLEEEGEYFYETTPYQPHSPYSASKASSDMLVKAYIDTYHFPANVTNTSNNYGPYHFPEKLIPLMIANALNDKKLPVYGKGENVRDWLYVEDHCKGIDLVLRKGRLGEVYNIGGFNEEQNINIVKLVIDILKDEIIKNDKYKSILQTSLDNVNYDLITYVQDRLGHDMRYAIDPSKIAKELGWYPETDFETGIRKTVVWYLENQKWVEEVISGEYQKYYDNMYGGGSHE